MPILLVAEDNADIRNFVKSYFEDSYNVITAKDGAEAYELGRQYIPDIIITDLMMPKMDGYQLCKKLKTDVLTSHITIEMLTVKVSEESQMKGLKYGADHYVTKPFNPQMLELILANIIKQNKDLAARWRLLASQEGIKLQTAFEGLSDIDQEFLNRTEKVILENLSDSKFSVLDLSRQLEYSKSQLYRKLKSVTNHSPNEFIRSVRLKAAAELIRNSAYHISEITYKVGFNDLKYFRTCFKKQFGVNPSEYKSEEPKNQTT